MMKEMKKKENSAIYLIDDDKDSIMGIVRSIFPALWQVEKEDGKDTHICLFGNAETVKESFVAPWNSQDEIKLSRQIEDVLWDLCRIWEEEQGDVLKETQEGDKFEQKVKLVRENVHILYKSDDKEEVQKEYENLYRIWTGNVVETKNDENGVKEKNNYVISKEAREAAKILIGRMNIPQGANVLLDLSLFWNDIERTLDNQPILSMQMYDLLKGKHKCILYSKYIMLENFIKNWIDTYRKYFSVKEKIMIYQKNELSVKEITEENMDNLTNV